MVEEWVSRQQETLGVVRSRLIACRTLLLQVVAAMTHAEEGPAEAEGKCRGRRRRRDVREEKGDKRRSLVK